MWDMRGAEGSVGCVLSVGHVEGCGVCVECGT